MSEVTNTDVENDKVQNEQPEVDVAALIARMEKLEATNNRLLEESKTNKAKYQGLRTEVEEKEKAQLTESENWKELLEIEKNKRSDFETQLKNTKKTVLQKELQFKVAQLAADTKKGYLDDVMRNLPQDLITIDEESLTVAGVEEALNVVREKKPDFFKSEIKSGMTSGRPVADIEPAADERSTDEKLADALQGFV